MPSLIRPMAIAVAALGGSAIEMGALDHVNLIQMRADLVGRFDENTAFVDSDSAGFDDSDSTHEVTRKTMSPLQAMANDPVYEPRVLQHVLQQAGAPPGGLPIVVSPDLLLEDLYVSESETVVPANHDNRPRALIMDGCSSSTYILQLGRRLLEAHGIRAHDGGEGGNDVLKLLKHTETNLTAPELALMKSSTKDSAKAIKVAADAVTRGGASLTFKISTSMNVWTPSFTSMSASLAGLDTQTVLVWRENVLDWAVCQMRDCFDGIGVIAGHPVDTKGVADERCFKRREDAGVTTLAKVDTVKLTPMLKELLVHRDETLERLQAVSVLKNTAVALTTEALLDFEYAASDASSSLTAWSQLLQGWGVTPDKLKVKKILQSEPLAGKLPPPGSQSQVIYNFEDAKTAIIESGLERFLRGDAAQKTILTGDPSSLQAAAGASDVATALPSTKPAVAHATAPPPPTTPASDTKYVPPLQPKTVPAAVVFQPPAV